MGILQCCGTTFMPDTFLEGMPASHCAAVSRLPIWSTLTWGLGVLGGTFGSILPRRNRRTMAAFARGRRSSLSGSHCSCFGLLIG